MNAPHLDLADLIGPATSEPADGADDRVLEHLAHCADCRAEADRWSLVAAGVRSLADTAPEMPGTVVPSARPQLTAPHMLAGPGRRPLLAASAAAALLLVGGVGYGTATALTGHAPGTSGTGAQAAVLTSVDGCITLKQLTGTLEQVNGSNLVIRTPNGQPVTVTTTASTRIGTMVGQLGDITNGSFATVTGPVSDGTIAAQAVGVGKPTPPNIRKKAPAQSAPPKPLKQLPTTAPSTAQRHTQPQPGATSVQGTVADASATGFTVVESDGAQVPVTTSSSTHVKLIQPPLTDLRTGAKTVVAGYPGQDGTLTAAFIVQPLPGGILSLHVQGCSPTAIDTEFTKVLAAGD